MARRIGKYTLILENMPSIISYAGVASKKESEGPLGAYFDIVNKDSTFGQSTWEKAESEMLKTAVKKAIEKGKLETADINYIFAGDLLNQCISASYGIRELGIPFIGLYGACSTMAEGLCMSSLFIEGNFAKRCIAATSSHFCSAERQFRFPLEYGGQRTPTSQWTVTGSGAVVVSQKNTAPYVKAVTIGRIQDLGIKDANNMGAAMAPAAADTISNFLLDTVTQPTDYDLILTGDLGSVGTELLYRLMEERGFDITNVHNDCGLMIFDKQSQDVHAGGSGCGCAATVLTSYILPQVSAGKLRNILFIATGALLSTTSVQQGESIPGIAHLVQIVG